MQQVPSTLLPVHKHTFADTWLGLLPVELYDELRSFMREMVKREAPPPVDIRPEVRLPQKARRLYIRKAN